MACREHRLAAPPCVRWRGCTLQVEFDRLRTVPHVPVNDPQPSRASHPLRSLAVPCCASLHHPGEVGAALRYLCGVPSAAEELMVTRDIALARLTGGWIHIAHVSTEESVNIIRRAKGEGIRVTAEVTPHHLTLTEEKVVGYDTNAKVNPPLRTARDVQALIQGLKDGAIDIIATDHAPHTQADKAGEFASTPSGISGFETALGSLLTLVHNGRLTLTDLISKLTSEPARILAGRHGNLGTLAVGAPADITLLDPNREWLVDTDAFVSKGRNTPLAGSRLKGKIMATLSHGNMVYSDDLVAIDEKGKK